MKAFRPDGLTIGHTDHNAALHPIQGIQPEFLLARFAWAIFPYLAAFLDAGVERFLLLKDEINTDVVSGDDCRRLVRNQGKSKSRSSSPGKRRAGDALQDSIE